MELKCVCLSNSELYVIKYRWKTIFWKLSSVNGDSCVDIIKGYLGYLSIQGEMDKNKVSFLNKMSSHKAMLSNLCLRYVVKPNLCLS